jgi:SAM-dependent methyltransferase
MSLPKEVYEAVIWLNHRFKRASIKLVKWTGKHPEYVHPKHLLGDDSDSYWYLPFIQHGDHVLDVGCGTGFHAVRTARICRSVTGFDINDKSLDIGRRTARSLGLDNLKFQAGSAEEPFPFGDGSFSKVLMLDILEHLHRRDAALAEARRVLAPGGHLLLAVPNRMSSWRRKLRDAGAFPYSDPDHKFEYTLEELVEQLGRHGFEPSGVRPVVFDTPWAGAIDLVGGISLRLYKKLQRWKKDAVKTRPEESIGFQVVCARR